MLDFILSTWEMWAFGLLVIAAIVLWCATASGADRCTCYDDNYDDWQDDSKYCGTHRRDCPKCGPVIDERERFTSLRKGIGDE